MSEPIRVSPAAPFSEPAPTWQEQLYPGLLPESIAEQAMLFADMHLFRRERVPAARPMDPKQGRMFS